MTASVAVLVPLAVDPVLYGAYVAAWAFFAYGPQLVICMLFAWSACRRTRGDMLTWLTKGFLWSLLPFVGRGGHVVDLERASQSRQRRGSRRPQRRRGRAASS